MMLGATIYSYVFTLSHVVRNVRICSLTTISSTVTEFLYAVSYQFSPALIDVYSNLDSFRRVLFYPISML